MQSLAPSPKGEAQNPLVGRLHFPESVLCPENNIEIKPLAPLLSRMLLAPEVIRRWIWVFWTLPNWTDVLICALSLEAPQALGLPACRALRLDSS